MRALLLAALVVTAGCQTVQQIADLPETSRTGDLAGIDSILIEIDPASVAETPRFVEVLRTAYGSFGGLPTRVSAYEALAPGASAERPGEARLVVLGRRAADALGRETFVGRLDLYRGDAVVWHHATAQTQIALTETERIESAARQAARRLAEATAAR